MERGVLTVFTAAFISVQMTGISTIVGLRKRENWGLQVGVIEYSLM